MAMFTRSTSKSAWTFVWSHWLNRRLWPGGYVALMVLVLGGSGPAQAQTGTTVAWAMDLGQPPIN